MTAYLTTMLVVVTSEGRPTVYFHVGPPKTGTTYIQGVLRYWQSDLEKEGVLVPTRPRPMHAALDARGDHGFGFGEGGDIPRVRALNAWPRLVKKVKAFDGVVVVSHELFATADAEHAAAAVRDLAGTDLHLVVTARDPARQLVSAWQQRIKLGSPTRFGTVSRKVGTDRKLSPAQQIPDLLDRWGSTLAADHVHVVTVPPSGSDPTVLWTRFAGVIGIDPQRYDPSHAPRSNKSLGVTEIELLRRVNLALADRLPHPGYGKIVTRLYANQILAGIESPSPTLPAKLWPIAEELAEAWVDQIRERGYDVRGDLDDLRPRQNAGSRPQENSEAAIAESAVQATAELLLELARRTQTQHPTLRTAREKAADSASFLRAARQRLLRRRRSDHP